MNLNELKKLDPKKEKKVKKKSENVFKFKINKDDSILMKALKKEINSSKIDKHLPYNMYGHNGFRIITALKDNKGIQQITLDRWLKVLNKKIKITFE